MPPVFAHGRLRLYLLKLLDEAPRHGYEVIRLLEERFQGLYAPSAGTVYPRLAKLAAEGLVTQSEEGGRKVYSLTDAGRAELSARQAELADLEQEIHASLAALAADIREDVSGTAGRLRQEMRHAADAARSGRTASGAQARTEERFEQAARRVQDRLRRHASAGDWPATVRESMGALGREIGAWKGPVPPRPPESAPPPAREDTAEEPVADPRRELERLLDGLRDDVRDAARDHGVTQEQLRTARRHLTSTADQLVALLRSPGK